MASGPRERNAVPDDSAGSLRSHLLQIVDVLRSLRLPYMVIGAFALPAWGRPRASLDLDFMIQTVQVPETLISKLHGLGYRIDEDWERYNPMIRSYQKRFRRGRIPVDILANRDKQDVAAFSRRKRKRFDSRFLWFPAPEDLLLQKLKVGRPQDLIDAAGIAERMRGRLDRAYLSRWAKVLGITAELTHVL
jgi:hypothetical protein